LVRLAVAGVLRDDHAGHRLDHLAGSQQRALFDSLARHDPLARRVGDAERVIVAPDHLYHGRDQFLGVAGKCKRKQGRGEREPIHNGSSSDRR
jgi:hypothetical protein